MSTIKPNGGVGREDFLEQSRKIADVEDKVAKLVWKVMEQEDSKKRQNSEME